MKIGVLASQGAFVEHIAMLKKLGVESIPVRLPHQLAGLDGLIIPGGESTAISRLMRSYKLTSEIKKLAEGSFPIFGTCAGMILLSKQISGPGVEPLGVMDIQVKRNAFGRQTDSFETNLNIPELGAEPFPAVFIRAPIIDTVGNNAEVLAKLENGNIVAVRQGKLLACAFHPELTSDLRFHQYFIDIVSGHK